MKPDKIAAPKIAAKPALPELTRQWAAAKTMEETGKREAAAKRDEILAHPEAKPGYADDYLVLGEGSDLDLGDEKLLVVLREEGLLGKCSVPTVKADLVRAAAKFNERLERAIERATEKKPRFEQAAKKKTKDA